MSEMSAEERRMDRLGIYFYTLAAGGSPDGWVESFVRAAVEGLSQLRVSESLEALEWWRRDVPGVLSRSYVRDVPAAAVVDVLDRAIPLIRAAMQARAQHRAQLRTSRGQPHDDLTSGGFSCPELIAKLTPRARYSSDIAATAAEVLSQLILDPDGFAPPQDFKEALDWALTEPFPGDIDQEALVKPVRAYLEALRARCPSGT